MYICITYTAVLTLSIYVSASPTQYKCYHNQIHHFLACNLFALPTDSYCYLHGVFSSVHVCTNRPELAARVHADLLVCIRGEQQAAAGHGRQGQGAPCQPAAVASEVSEPWQLRLHLLGVRSSIVPRPIPAVPSQHLHGHDRAARGEEAPHRFQQHRVSAGRAALTKEVLAFVMVRHVRLVNYA